MDQMNSGDPGQMLQWLKYLQPQQGQAQAMGQSANAAQATAGQQAGSKTGGVMDTMGSAALMSGNPYAMAAGAGLKAANYGLQIYDALQADEAEKEAERKRAQRQDRQDRFEVAANAEDNTTSNMGRAIKWAGYQGTQMPSAAEMELYTRQRMGAR